MHSKIFTLAYIVQLCLGCSSSVQVDLNDSQEMNETTPLFERGHEDKVTDRYPLMVSYDFGETWESASGDLPPAMQVSFLEPKGLELVLASDNMGVFISSQNKSTWKAIGNNLPNQKINALTVVGDEIYVGVYQSGIFRTTDDGQTWEALNFDLPNLNVLSILQIDQQLIAGTDAGIYTLDAHTESWKRTNAQSQTLSLYEFDNILIAGTSQGTLISTNGGMHWEWIRQEGSVHYTHNIGKRIVELALNGDLVYSDDWGASWTKTQYEPRASAYVYEIIECGDFQLLSNNYGIHRSTDYGATWELIFKTESMVFLDLIPIENEIYGGTRIWDEFRNRTK
ncbi:hypothetical protein [Sanyastnella coralliicola]|uniref:hypothetical protein n=1 Tax=Sanyastnella coralliicola TaxID=3069118 RepID=UPI0027BA1339|nr:hypothetical protein [Longitalea sp. SCSIO 12813]